jgi:hypothetical protein
LRKASGDSAGQMADLNEGLKRQPNNAAALYERGLLKNARNDAAGALADFDSAIKIEPTNSEFLKSRAMLRAAGKGKDATQEIAALDELISLEPNNAKNYYRRGLAYTRDHDADRARADFKMALAKDRRMKEASRALDRLAKDSKHWKKKTVEAKAAPAAEIVAEPKAEAKASVVPADSSPPDAAVSDRRAPEAAPTTKNSAKNTDAPKPVDVPQPPQRAATAPVESKTEVASNHRQSDDDASERPQHDNRRASRATPQHRAATRASNERYQTYRRPADTRRPQVRYYYYRNGRQVTFSEAFR